MKFFLLSFYLFCICFCSFGQKKVLEKIESARTISTAQKFELFSITNTVNIASESFIAGSSLTELILNDTELGKIESNKPGFLNISVPISAKQSIELELVPINIFTSGFKVTDANDKEITNFPKGVFYEGIIKGESQSIASISIINGEIAGIISYKKGNINLAKIKNATTYAVYNDIELKEKSKFTCAVDASNANISIPNVLQSSSYVSCDTVKIYFEADNALYQWQSSSTNNVTAYVNNLFSKVATLYDNEGIIVGISQLKIWTTADPYASTTTTNDMLTAFGTQVGNTFTGNVAHLLSSRNLGGGLAWVDVLCSKGTGVSTALNNTLSNIPTYSWSVEEVTHELGHNFGSPHTQSCSWAGGAIDNCYAVEGTCSPGPAPTNGGTIMSYCHLTSYGINFSNGFGTLPGNLIRQRTIACMNGLKVTANKTEICGTGASAILTASNCSGTVTWSNGLGTGTSINVTPTTTTTYTATCTGASCTITPGTIKISVINATPISSTACIPTYPSGASGYYGISNFTFNTINCNSGTASVDGSSYIDRTCSQQTTVVAGNTYTFSMQGSWYGKAYIDYNNDGDFNDAGEQILDGLINSGLSSSIIIPTSATTNTFLRIRLLADNTSGSSACSLNGNSGQIGQIEDYAVKITCTTPTAPTAINGSRCGTGTVYLATSGCSGIANWYANATGGTVLSTGNNYTTPSISTTTTYYVDCSMGSTCISSRTPVTATINTGTPPAAPIATSNVVACTSGTANLVASGCAGIYNWYSASLGGTSLGTGTTFTTPTLSSPTNYYVDCTVGVCTSTRTAVIAAVNTATPISCIPTYPSGASGYYGISNFTFNTINFNSGTASVDGSNYIDRTCSQQTTVVAGNTYTFSMQGSWYGKAYIDYNNDGDFNDAGEQILNGLINSGLSSSIIIPTSATTDTFLRIRLLADNTSGSSACSLNGNGGQIGQIEDYAVKITNCPQNLVYNIANAPQAAGVYQAGQTITSQANVATGTTYNAGKSITLLPGFSAGNNETFLAKIKGCP